MAIGYNADDTDMYSGVKKAPVKLIKRNPKAPKKTINRTNEIRKQNR